MLLPQSVGPGPVQLVMREVLSMLINVAYKSSRVLRELQTDGVPNPDMQQQVLGAKYVQTAQFTVPHLTALVISQFDVRPHSVSDGINGLPLSEYLS